jgi:hypothetical protein
MAIHVEDHGVAAAVPQGERTSRVLDDARLEGLSQIRPAIDEVIRMTASAIVCELTSALGAQLVAGIAGETTTAEVHSWEGGKAPARIDSLRAALQATRAIMATSGAATARSWFVGCSSRLNFVSPLESFERTRKTLGVASLARRTVLPPSKIQKQPVAGIFRAALTARQASDSRPPRSTGQRLRVRVRREPRNRRFD